MTVGTLVVAGAVLGLAAGVGGAALPRQWRTMVPAVLVWGACALEGAAAIRVLASDHPVVLRSTDLLPLTGVELVLTPLGAFFVLLVAMVAVPATLHGIGYAPHGLDSRMAACAFPTFVTVLLLVPAAGSVATFMVLWELMALTSLSLVLVDHGRRPATRSAGTWYAVITHVGAATILVTFLILATHADGQSFGALRVAARHLNPTVRALVFLLALVGFGSKAGVVPFHVWLPKAHPEAPSPVSALMSGAMVALGVYGIVLVGDVLLGGGPLWWWLVVLVLGAASALFGSLQAASSTDLKRLLAYSTTDNVGLALLAVGASGLFASTRHPLLAALGLVAALVLLLNHAAFKGALFLSAGSVQTATGTRDLDHLGGLLRRMPQTGALFLAAAAAVCALPPLNGFIGEWLLFQSLLHGSDIGNTAGEIAIPLAVAAMALTAGLTVVAFVKAAGIGFLGRPRSAGAEAAGEVPGTMRLAVGLLVAVCVVLGVVPTLVLPAVERAVRTALPGVRMLPLAHGVDLQLIGLRGVLEPASLALALVVGIAVVTGVRRVLARRPAPRRSRGLGMRPPVADGPHAVHGHLVRRAGPARLRRRAAARPGPRREPRGRVALRHSVDDVPQRRGRRDRARPLPSGHPGRSTLRPGGAPAAAGQRPPLPGLRTGGTGHRARRPGGDAVSSDSATVASVLTSGLQVIVVAGGGLVLTGAMRKVRARLEGRVGAPVLQPLIDVRKLFRKQRIRPDQATWVFPLAPVVLVATVAVGAAITPLVTTHPALGVTSDLFALVYLLLIGSALLALAGLDAGTAFGGMGSSRAVTIGALAEPALLVTILALAATAHSSNLPAIVRATLADPGSVATPQRLFALGALLVVIVAESGRLPVDNPATHLELTMIHEAMILEYSGPDLALVTVGEAMRLQSAPGRLREPGRPLGRRHHARRRRRRRRARGAGGQGGGGRTRRWPSSRCSRPSSGSSGSRSFWPAPSCWPSSGS